MRPEASIERYMLSACRKGGILAIKNTGMNGMPDRMLIYGGRIWFVELKAPGGKPTELQLAIAEKLKAKGCVTLCADGKEKIDAIISAITAGDMPPERLIY